MLENNWKRYFFLIVISSRLPTIENPHDKILGILKKKNIIRYKPLAIIRTHKLKI